MRRADIGYIVIFGVVASGLIGALVIGPVPQDPNYYAFADMRGMLAVPHVWNVITNVPFLVVGTMGLILIARGRATGGLPELGPIYFVFFLDVLATGFGSSYYHYNPTNQTLLWDRIPMSIAFTHFFSAVLGEHISAALSRKAVWPLIVVEICSVLYWYVSEKRGSGDLRFYILLQFLPVLLIPVILFSDKSWLVPGAYTWAVMGACLAAKIAESLDRPLYAATHILSEHSIKHLAAACGVYIFYRALYRRKSVSFG